MLASKHFTIVLGIDFHATTLPPYNPLQPYIGLVFDIGNLIPFIGCKTFINGLHHGVADTSGILVTLYHIPILTGPFVKQGFLGNESVNFLGGLKTYSEGRRLSAAPNFVMTCSDVGLPLSLRPGLKSFKPVPTLFLPTSRSIPISLGPPVYVGGPYVPDLEAVVLNLVMSYGFGCLIKKGGQLLNKQIKKIGADWSDRLAKFLCRRGFDPVNLATGAVEYEGTDFELPGPLPLAWKRAWLSDSKWKGILGHGCHSCFDMRVQSFPENECLVVTLDDGRPAFFPELQAGQSEFNRAEKLILSHRGDCYELFDPGEQKIYTFAIQASSKESLLTTITNETGHQINLQYHHGNLRKITDSAGRILDISTDDHKRITKVELAVNKHTKEPLVSYVYNDEGDMTEITDGLGQTTRIVYSNHLMIKKTDRNGQTFYWKYDGNKPKSRCIHTWGDGGLLEGRIEYHKGYNLVTDSLGHTTRYEFKPDGRITAVIDPLGAAEFTDYTEEGDILRDIDADGNITGYEYSPKGELLAIHYPDGSAKRYAYNENGRLTSETTPGGATTIYLYGKHGWLERTVSPDNQVTTYLYNEQNLIAEIKASGKRDMKLTYDEQGNLTEALLPDGLKSEWTYDYRGRLIKSRNATGQVSSYLYDELGRIVQSVAPDGNAVKLTYNAYEEVISAEDGQRKVEFEYTPLGSLKKRKESGHTLDFAYNKEEQLTSLRNEAGEHYTFSRDGAGRICAEKGFDGLTRTYKRTPGGLVRHVDRPGERSADYVYDSLGRLCGVEYHDGTYEQYAYNKDGLLIEAYNPNSHLKIKRDKMGRILEEWQDGHTVTSQYNKLGERSGLTSSLGANLTMDYTKAGLLQAIQTDNWAMHLQYNARGLEIERQLTGGVRSRNEYDHAGRVLRHSVMAGNRLTRRMRYQWSQNDRLMNIVNELNHQNTWFDYDTLGNLVGSTFNETEHLFRVPDAVGNLYKTANRSDRKYDKGGRLLEADNTKYHYDEEGNLAAKVDNKGKIWRYEWNANGSLRSVVRPDRQEVRFEYDPLQRRTTKIFGERITRWVWDGNTPLHEWNYKLDERPKIIKNEFGLLHKEGEEPVDNLITWVFEEGTFHPAAKLKGDKAYSIITDYLGTPVEMYNDEGRKIWETRLDIYGKVATFEGSSLTACPFRYQGQYEDVETGLYYNRFRYYDPNAGVYMSQDPIGLEGGGNYMAMCMTPTVGLMCSG